MNAYKEKQMKRRIDSLISKNKIDGYKNYSECCVVNEAKLHEMYEVSDFEGGYEDWLEEEEARVSQMDTAEYAEYLEEIYGIECEMVEESYTFSYTPES